MSTKHNICLLLLAAGLGRAVPALALSAAPADSLARAAGVDSLSAPATPLTSSTPDSLTAATPDTLGVPGMAEPDSTALLEGSPPSPAGAASEELAREAGLPWYDDAVVGPALLDWTRPESLDEVIGLVPGAGVRVAGDRGMQAFHTISPVSTARPEVWVDGIPTRNPADRDPGIWDRSGHPVARLTNLVSDPAHAGGDPGLALETAGPAPGRTLLDSQFSSTRRETYFRAVRVSTPAATRTLGLDFEEWKTEEGIAYSLAPAVVGDPDAGRVKMRRFRLHGAADTGAGRVSLVFGRGRRLHPVSSYDARTADRWTGELAVGIDRETESGRWRLRGWHLDWHEHEAFADVVDGSRLGLRIDRRPRGRLGWRASATIERWSGRFQTPQDTVITPTPQVARLLAGARVGIGERAQTWAHVELAFAEHASEQTALGGGAGWIQRVAGTWSVDLGGLRQVRSPSLAESFGRDDLETVTPTLEGFEYPAAERYRIGAGELPFEVQDRAWVGTSLTWAGWRAEGSVERWWLRDGIGWLPDGSDAARTVGALELEVDQVVGRLLGSWGLAGLRLRAMAQGHRVLADLERDASRGTGHPLYGSRLRLGIERRFFSERNRLGVDADLTVVGPRFDDLSGALGGAQRETDSRLDLRLWLRVRDATLALVMDNALDTEQDLVLGSVGRPRQLRYVLVWPFFN